MSKFMTRFAKDESGATAIEYGMIIALIAVAVIGTLGLIGDELAEAFTTIGDDLAAA